MEHRQGYQIKIMFAYILLCICSLWYIGVPKEYESRGESEREIPAKEAKVVVQNYNPKLNYFLKEEYILNKQKTFVPFRFKKDTVYKSGQRLMTKSCDCGS
jgi:hypothetical protein